MMGGVGSEGEGVGKTGAEVGFDQDGLVERSPRARRNLPGERGNARIERRELQIGGGDLFRIIGGCSAQLVRNHGREQRKAFVSHVREIAKWIEDRTSEIAKKITAAGGRDRVRPLSRKNTPPRKGLCRREQSIPGPPPPHNVLFPPRLKHIPFSISPPSIIPP